jgi:hypothetical protein
MIQLRSDCLVFEVAGGEKIPCSAETVTVELLGDAAGQLDPETIREAAAAVLHYFKEDLGREVVTVGEFTETLERVLRGFGLNVQAQGVVTSAPGVVEEDLLELAQSAGGRPLEFFPRLQARIAVLAGTSPRLLRFSGLRPCAKRLAARRRWCPSSEALGDEIVAYIRHWWDTHRGPKDCALVIG